MAEEIKVLFPEEDSKIYYSPSYRNSQNESVAASGKLYRFYKKTRKLFIESKLLDKKEVEPDEIFESKNY